MLTILRSGINWLMSPGYPKGVVWAILTAFISIMNDVITRQVGTRLDGLEIGFFRFFFSMLTVLPFMLQQGKSSFMTKNPAMHFWRAAIGTAAIALYIYGVILLPLAEVTTFSFTQPLFLMPLALLFLKEKVSRNRWFAALFGFIGIVIMVQPGSDSFNSYVFIPMGSALLFACLDLLAKKMVTSEGTTTLLFYFALGTSIVAFFPALSVWKTPNFVELFWLILLGAGANLIQVCLFCAFRATDASSLAPFRYVEFIFASFFGYWLYSEALTSKTLMGAAIIVGSTLYLSYFETKWKKSKI